MEEPPQAELTDEEVEEELKNGILKGLDLSESVAKPESIAALKRMLSSPTACSAAKPQ